MPKVSIVILIYMVEQYVRKTIESVLAQTYDNIEIILAVRKGPDHSFEICQEYADKCEKVVLVERKGATRGQGRNEGIEAVKGEYVLFVDGDDWMESTMIESLVDSILKYDADMAVCGDIYDFEQDNVESIIHLADIPELLSQEEFYREILSRRSFGLEVWNKMYKLSKVKDVPFGDEQAEDRFWSAKVFEKLDKIAYVRSPEFHYNVRASSGSRKPHVMESSMLADCIMVDNIRTHNYLKRESSYFLFNSCYNAIYAALRFEYFNYSAFHEIFIKMKDTWKDVIAFSNARNNDKVKAFIVGLGYRPIIWFAKLSIKMRPSGLYDSNEEV